MAPRHHGFLVRPDELGRILRDLREERGWSQREVAEQIDTGKGYVSNIENGEISRVPVLTIVRFAKLYRVKPLVLLSAYFPDVSWNRRGG